jgi:predicted nucleic acid-binding protein
MVTTDYLADTNILILLLDGNPSITEFLQDKNLYISFVSEMELLSKPNITRDQIRIIRNMIDSCVLVEMNDRIKFEAIRIRREYKIKLPDAIIAATAKYLRIPLMTIDKDFRKVNDIYLFHIML